MLNYFKRVILFFFTLFVCTTLFAQTPLSISASQKLSELLNRFNTFEAQFMQTTTDTEQQIVARSHGRMMMQRPNHFRWETQSPSHQIIITNGKKMWVYDVDLKQATEESIANSPMNPAKLLSGNTQELLQQFTVHLIPHRDLTVFQLIPKKPNQQFRAIAMVFSHDQLQRMQIENNAEQTTTFTFSDIKLNSSLSPELFEFAAPRGVDVMR